MPAAASIAACAREPAISCCHIRLSNGSDALISRITAAGPSAKRPPHIALESALRPLIVPLLALALIAGCDRQKPAAPQGTDTAAADTAAADAGDEPTPPPLPKDALGSVDITHRGEAAPAVPFEGPTGSPATLATWRGKPLIVNLWATWCAPCIAEMPALDRLAAREQGRLTLVTVSQDMAGRRAVTPFFAKHGFTALQPNLDKTSALLMAVKSESLPLTIFYDAQGREQWRVTGSTDWDGAKAAKLIDGAIGA